MTTIYLVRHCEALGNAQRIFQGHINTPITDLGAKQLEFLKTRFENIKLDKIYSSPLERAIKTAQAVKGSKNIEVIPCDGLIELDGGFIDGKPFKETFESIPGLADTWDNHPEDFAPQGGEPMRHAYERIYNTLLNLAKENRGKTIACATHGGVTRCILCRILHNDIAELKNTPWANNTAVALIKIDESDNITLEYYNDTSHVPEEFIPKRNRISTFMRTNK